ncbi:MAG: TIGR04013 family B12-binding domain/radical SAM domain-containing protein, partial [Thermoprotei archaeon]
DITWKYNKAIFLMGFFTTDFVQNYNFYKGIMKLKEKSNVMFIAGGPHPSGDPIGTLLFGFDVVFIGEAEASLVDFVYRFINDEDYFSVKGISYIDHEQEKIIFTGRSMPVKLNDYPPYAPRRKLFNPIEITRGCPYMCRFCQTPFIFGAKIRHRSIESILKWSEFMAKHGRRDIRFITPNALSYGSETGLKPNYTAVQDLIINLYNLINRRYQGRIFYGSFPSEMRPEFIEYEILRFLKRYVSNKRIIVGMQSGSDRVLKLIKRGHSVEEALNAVQIALDTGFRVEVDFIFGFPFETEDDYNETLRVIRKITDLGAIVHAHTFLPLPGTPLGDLNIKPLPYNFKRELTKLIGRRKLYGAWEKQERLALLINKFKIKGIIKSTRTNYQLLAKGEIPLARAQ